MVRMKFKTIFSIIMLCCMTGSTLLMTFYLIMIAAFGYVVLYEPNELILLGEIIMLLFASVFSLIHLFKYGTKLGRRDLEVGRVQ